MNINKSHNSALKLIFEKALQSVNGRRCVAQYLQQDPLHGDVCLVSIGKAACQMAKGAQLVLGNRIRDNLIITKHDGCAGEELTGLHVVQTGHPVPDQRSLQAGQQLLTLLREMPASVKLLFLISGGASALVEALPASFDLEHLQRLNQWLLHSGLPIDTMNAIRKQVSAIKGGRLAQYLNGRDTTVLFISDVQGDDPAVIGSGLLFASDDALTSSDAQKLPPDILDMLNQTPPMPEQGDDCFKSVRWKIIASLQQAINAANNAAKDLGYETIIHQDYLQGDAIKAGRDIAQSLQSRPGKLHIWGGETTVTLPDKPGTGGRCQSLALSAAMALHHHQQWSLLAAGTDGDDGNSGAAGVCIDATSLERATQKPEIDLAPADYLKRADAGTLFAASCDLLITGPTGTNVTDLVMGYLNDYP